MTTESYKVNIYLGVGQGALEGDMVMSFGSMKGSSSEVLELSFNTDVDVLAMMEDDKSFIRFTNKGYTDQEYFFFKANILYVSQWER